MTTVDVRQSDNRRILFTLWVVATAALMMLIGGTVQTQEFQKGAEQLRHQAEVTLRITSPDDSDGAQKVDVKNEVPAPAAQAPDPEAGMSPQELIARWNSAIAEASKRFGVPAAWIRAIMRVESGGHTMLNGQPITSRVGAEGLMQLMQETYSEMRTQYALGGNAYNPHDNIMAGAAYLKFLKSRFSYPYLFAAYNAGPARVSDHLTKGKPLPLETRNYIARVVTFLGPQAKPAKKALIASDRKDAILKRVAR